MGNEPFVLVINSVPCFLVALQNGPPEQFVTETGIIRLPIEETAAFLRAVVAKVSEGERLWGNLSQDGFLDGRTAVNGVWLWLCCWL